LGIGERDGIIGTRALFAGAVVEAALSALADILLAPSHAHKCDAQQLPKFVVFQVFSIVSNPLLLNTRVTMANILLDSPILFTTLTGDAKSTSRNFWARNGTLSTASSGGPKTPQHDPRPSTTGASQDDAVLISSDDETTYSDFDDGQSDTSFPPFEEISSYIWLQFKLIWHNGDFYNIILVT
jgi:hypothetical protein